MPPTTKPQTIGLVMIVKNEAENMLRLVTSIKPLLSHWSILDTGSTDETLLVINETLGDLPGELHHGEFVNFGQARSEAIGLARGTADYLLMLDADMQIRILDRLPHLQADVYSLPIKGFPFDYRMPLLMRGGLEWRYEGVVHEHLAGNDYPNTPAAPLDCWEANVDHSPERQSGKGERYIDLLTADFARNPENPRTVFYLAQTHRDLGNIDQAISFYRLRCAMGGWDQENYYARYQLGCLLATHISFYQGADELLRASRERPGRIEALRALANSANAVADKAAIPDDVLFVHRDLYA